jgi:hypothetical protein
MVGGKGKNRVNMKKLDTIAKLLKDFEMYQSACYPFEEVPIIRNYLLNLEPFDEVELYKMAKTCEEALSSRTLVRTRASSFYGGLRSHLTTPTVKLEELNASPEEIKEKRKEKEKEKEKKKKTKAKDKPKEKEAIIDWVFRSRSKSLLKKEKEKEKEREREKEKEDKEKREKIGRDRKKERRISRSLNLRHLLSDTHDEHLFK